MKYAIVLEKSATGYGVYVPDLPGCVAVAETDEEARSLIRDAIVLHLEGIQADGGPIPAPSSQVGYVEVSPAA